MTENDLGQIPLNKLRKDIPNPFRLGNNRDVVIVWDSNTQSYQAYVDFCPHMGAKMSEGHICKKTGRFVCPWHGYEFSSETGSMEHNPGEVTFARMRGSYKGYDPKKTPKYQLARLECKTESQFLKIVQPVSKRPDFKATPEVSI